MSLILTPQPKDLGGGLLVRRMLPSLPKPAVGPFVFFDHFGPVTAKPGDNHDVRPHPHIGLATVSYLYEGAMMHRDSVGAVQRVEPGAVNLMLAGRGVVHSERAPDDLRDVAHVSHGLQLWIGLPEEREEDEPTFTHVSADRLPSIELPGGITVRVLMGTAFGVTSPVPQYSPTLYLDIAMPAGSRLELPAGLAEEAAVYAVDAPVQLDGQEIPLHRLAVLDDPSHAVRIDAHAGPARLAVVGGAPLGHRFLWWNFVSSRRERIVQAADDWAGYRFPEVPGDNVEFIPLPAKRPT